MIVPVGAPNFAEGLRAVPRGWLEGSLALGVNRWRTFWKVAVRTARPALIAGTVLAFATATGRLTPHLLLALAFCVGTGRAFAQPSLQTALPNIVPASVLPRAIAGSTSAAQIAIVAGTLATESTSATAADGDGADPP